MASNDFSWNGRAPAVSSRSNVIVTLSSSTRIIEANLIAASPSWRTARINSTLASELVARPAVGRSSIHARSALVSGSSHTSLTSAEVSK